MAVTVDRAHAAAEMRAQGMYLREIGEALGISDSSVARLLDPAKADQHRLTSLEAKRRRTGTCGDCGGTTRYNGHKNKGASERCKACQLDLQVASKVWTAEAIVSAVQAWAELHGQPPRVTDWQHPSGDGGHPAATTVYNIPSAPFPTWNAAIMAAGFNPRDVGRYKRTPESLAKHSASLKGRPGRKGPRLELRKFDWDEARQMRGRGKTIKEIAAAFGVSYGAVWNSLNRTCQA